MEVESQLEVDPGCPRAGTEGRGPPSQRHSRKISADVDGGSRGGSSVRRPGREDPNL